MVVHLPGFCLMLLPRTLGEQQLVHNRIITLLQTRDKVSLTNFHANYINCSPEQSSHSTLRHYWLTHLCTVLNYSAWPVHFSTLPGSFKQLAQQRGPLIFQLGLAHLLTLCQPHFQQWSISITIFQNQ